MARIPLYTPTVVKTHLGPEVVQDVRGYAIEALAAGRNRREALEAQANQSLIAGKNWEEAGQFGEKLSKTALVLNQHLTSLQDMHDLDKAKNFVNQRALEYSQTVKNNQNPDEWLAAFRESMGTTREAALEGVSPRVAMYLDHHLTTVLPSYEKSLVGAARQYKISSFHGDIASSLDSAVKTIVDAPDMIVAANAEAGFKGLVRTGANPEYGYLKPAEAEQWIEKLDLGVKVAKLNKSMLSDPAGTWEAMQKPGAFGFDDTQRAAVMPKISANLHRVQGENALEVQKKYENKQLTPEDLKNWRDGRAINLGTWKFYDAALQADAAPVKAETDKELYIKRWKEARGGNLSEENVFNELKAGALTKGDAHFLLNTNERMRTGETPKELKYTKEPYFRLSMREIETRLKPLESLNRLKGMMPGAKEVSPTNEAAFLFMKACEEAQEKGELTGPWMWKKANEIILPFEIMGARGLKPGAGGAAAPEAAGGQFTPEQRQRAKELLDQQGKKYR